MHGQTDVRGCNDAPALCAASETAASVLVSDTTEVTPPPILAPPPPRPAAEAAGEESAPISRPMAIGRELPTRRRLLSRRADQAVVLLGTALIGLGTVALLREAPTRLAADDQVKPALAALQLESESQAEKPAPESPPQFVSAPATSVIPAQFAESAFDFIPLPAPEAKSPRSPQIDVPAASMDRATSPSAPKPETKKAPATAAPAAKVETPGDAPVAPVAKVARAAEVKDVKLAEGKEPVACSGGASHGTALHWAASPAAAAEQARAQGKLVFLIHVSGNFAIPEFT